ncbi:MAG TPA: YceI family protein [Candidatus Krumholzibacteria bacterium]|nr:YceI family protein [Candidatus Krumholzibacteria bacterium]
MHLKHITISAALFSLLAVAAHATEFVVKPGKPNEVVFTSKAASESFQGRTDQMGGSIVFDPGQVGDSVAVRIEVDLKSLSTGIGKRDQHMRDNHLETGKYPKATFVGVTVKGGNGPLVVGTPSKLDVEGNFTLHGVTRRLRTTVEVLLKDEHTLEFKTAFNVPLADYKIDRPKFLFLKLGEVQELTVTGVATAK